MSSAAASTENAGASASNIGPQTYSWIVVDTIDPMATWELSVPSDRLEVAATTLAKAGIDTGLFAWTPNASDDTPFGLPSFDALIESEDAVQGIVTLGGSSTVERRCANLGQCLIDGEPHIDATYRRRFADARPPIGLYVDADDAVLAICTWSDIFFTRPGAFAHEALADKANQARLQALLDAANSIARVHGGKFSRR